MMQVAQGQLWRLWWEMEGELLDKSGSSIITVWLSGRGSVA
jgi:hypothetical protein